MSPAPTDPSFLQNPSALAQFWGQDLSWSPRQWENQPPREGAFAGIFIPAGLFFSQLLFSSRDASLWVRASLRLTDRAAGALRLHEALHEMPIFLGWGEKCAEICFPERIVMLSYCRVLRFGGTRGNPALSPGGWWGPVPVPHRGNRRMISSFWLIH